jgi:hypothetical protein
MEISNKEANHRMMNKKAQESGFKNILFAFILMSLFGMLILTAVVQSGNIYGKDISEVVGGSLSLSKFNDSVTSVEQTSKDMKERFDKQSIWSAVAGVVVTGIFGIAKDMVTMILLPFDVLSDILLNTFGVPSYVTSTILGILILSIMFAIWRLIKIGD